MRLQHFGLLCCLCLLTTVPGFTQAAPPSAQVQSKPKTVVDVVGGYYSRGGFLNLKRDKTYTLFSGTDDGRSSTRSGTYTFQDDHVILTPSADALNSHADTLRACSRNRNRGMALPEFAEPMAPHVWKLAVVPWDKRLYLVGDEALRDFCNDVNMGNEPRTSFPGSYFARFEKGHSHGVDVPTGQPIVPAPWNTFLLSHPVTAPISAIVHTGREGQGPGGSGGEIIAITVDAGSNQNLQPGMLLSVSGPPEFANKYLIFPQYAWIKSVTPDQCVAEFTTFVADLPMREGMTASTHLNQIAVEHVPPRR